MDWIDAPKQVEELFGFVYIINNTTNGKWYIGQKQFHKKVTRPPLKGRKNKRRSTKESDWRKYTGSSVSLNEDIANGDVIEKRILHICSCKWEMNYVETMLQFSNRALLDDNSYNGIINLRIGNIPASVDPVTLGECLDFRVQ